MTVTAPHGVSPTLTAIIESQTTLAALYGLDSDTMDAAVREVVAALVTEAGHAVDAKAAFDCFVTLVDIEQRLTALHDNPWDYLASKPYPSMSYDVVRGTLLADRAHWMQRLIELAAS